MIQAAQDERGTGIPTATSTQPNLLPAGKSEGAIAWLPWAYVGFAVLLCVIASLQCRKAREDYRKTAQDWKCPGQKTLAGDLPQSYQQFAQAVQMLMVDSSERLKKGPRDSQHEGLKG